MTFEDDIAAALQTAALGTVGTDIYRGPTRVPDGGVPVNCIFVLQSGGFQPEPYINSTRKSWQEKFLEVRIRRKQSEYGAGRDLAQQVWNALHLATPPSGATWLKCRRAAPMYIGRDKAGHHEWLVELNVGIKEDL